MSQRSSESPFGTKITMEKCLSKHPSLLLGARASATKVCSLLTGQKKRNGVTNAWNKLNHLESKCEYFKHGRSVENIPSVQSVRSLTKNLSDMESYRTICYVSLPLHLCVWCTRAGSDAHAPLGRRRHSSFVLIIIGDNTDIVRHKISWTCPWTPDPISEEFSRPPSSPEN